MAYVASLICLVMAAVGALGVISPPRLLGFTRSFQSRRGLWVAAGLRVLLGVAFILAAPGSRAPGTFALLGVIIITIGIFTPMIGVARFKRLLDWWASRGTIFLRVWALAALGLGLLWAWAVLPVGG